MKKNNIFIADVEVVHPEPPEEKPPAVLKEKPRVKPAKRISRGRKSSLDDGKIMALFNAGWSYEKIADEMGVSPKTIQMHVANMREEGRL